MDENKSNQEEEPVWQYDIVDEFYSVNFRINDTFYDFITSMSHMHWLYESGFEELALEMKEKLCEKLKDIMINGDKQIVLE